MREMNDAAREGVESNSEVEPAQADCLECGRSPDASPNGAPVSEPVREHATVRAGKKRQSPVAASVRVSTIPRMVLLSTLALAASAAIVACPVSFDPLLALGVLICVSLMIWHPAVSRFTGALALAGTMCLLFVILRLGFEEHGLIPPSVLRGGPMPAWGLYSRFGSMDSSEWIRFGLSAAGLILLGGLALFALLGKLHGRPAQKS
jgi:hypothetical protein